MSWLFSRALVEASSAGSCSDGEQFAPSSGESTPQAYCAPDKTKVFSRLSRFGMTFKPLTEDLGAELLTLYLAGFPAKTSALPEKAQASTANARECGATWLGLLGKYDPASRSWKTAQRSFLGDLEESLVTWPRSGMTAGGECWELPMLERRTSATDSGLWPTPVKSDCQARRPSIGWDGNSDLPSVVWRRNGGEQNPQKPPAKLNPMWVEWLMGWPLGWTDLKPSGMDKFPSVLQQHGECLEVAE